MACSTESEANYLIALYKKVLLDLRCLGQCVLTLHEEYN